MLFSGRRKVPTTTRNLQLKDLMLKIPVGRKSVITATESVTLLKNAEALEGEIQDQDREARAGIETTEAEIVRTQETETDGIIDGDPQLDTEIEAQEEWTEVEMTHQEGTIGTIVIIARLLEEDQMKETTKVSPALYF